MVVRLVSVDAEDVEAIVGLLLAAFDEGKADVWQVAVVRRLCADSGREFPAHVAEWADRADNVAKLDEVSEEDES